MSQFSLGARVLIVTFVTCGLAQARQLNVRDSFPAAESILDGRNAQYIIRFDGGVDHGGSQMDVTENGKIVERIVPPATASLMFWPRLLRRCHRADTSSIGMRNRFPMVMFRMGSFPSRSRGDFGQGVIFVRCRLS